MSSTGSRQDFTLSAASFLASIGAESSTSFGSDTTETAANSAPSLPISAKVALIDAQIDSLETRIEQSVSAHAAKLRERAAATRSVDHDLNQLWQSINQTSSRMVTFGPQLAPIASEYRDALAQSSKQNLLISVLSDLLAAARQLETLEKLQQQSNWSALMAQLPDATNILKAFDSHAELQSLPTVVELRARFDRLRTQPAETISKPLSADARRTVEASQAHTTSEDGNKEKLDTSSAAAAKLSPAAKALETARAIIVSRGPEGGWKEVRIELDAPAPPPPAMSAPVPLTEAANNDSDAPSFDTRPEHLLRDQLTPASGSLSRNSSSSSTAANVRSKHKPKLGARVIRPQDQLGSGPFNAEDTALEGDGWDLDDDDDDIPAPLESTGSSSTAQPPQAAPHIAPVPHRTVAALAHDERPRSPISSGTMQRSISSTSSQRSSFAFQIDAPQEGISSSNGADAWDIEDEDSKAEPDDWALNDDNTKHQASMSSNAKLTGISRLGVSSHARQISSTDAWGLREDEVDAGDDLWKTPVNRSHVTSEAVSMPSSEAQIPTGEPSVSPPQHLMQGDIAQTASSSTKSVEEFRRSANISSGSSHETEPNKVEEAPVQTPAVQGIEAEREGDAWDFEEGSSASEGEKNEIAPITPLLKQEPSVKPVPVITQVSSATKTSAKTGAAHASPPRRSAEVVSKKTVASQRREIGSVMRLPSPTGWADDFSDGETTGIPAVNHHKEPGSGSSKRSVSASSNARVASPARHAAKQPDLPPVTVVVPKEECTISQRSLDLVNLAESTFNSVLSKLQTGHSSGIEAEQDDVEALAGTIFKIFEMHRALMPVAHGEVLRDVPSLAMQFFNDCEYLARELARLVAEKGDSIAIAWAPFDAEGARRWNTKELAKLQQEVTSTRGLGQRWFEAQMTSQSKILLDTLMDADGFARTFDDQRFARCERCIKQVVQTLQQLATAWRPVLVASRFHAAIGRLVDLAFQKVLHDVLDLEDIGESESEKIASLVKTLGSLESLFSVTGAEQQSAAPLWVPSWFKTSYLIEILTGSLVDIEFLAFEAGALVDYSRMELTGLIKALFADTPNRSKLLRRVESAPIEVLAH